MKTREIILIVLILMLALVMITRPGVGTDHTERLIDTVIFRDTVRDTVLVPQRVYYARTDTVWLWSPADTVEKPVEVPVERKEYRTDDYHAVVEGFRPELVSMAVFPETRYITATEIRTVSRRPRFAFGLQAGYGYNGKDVRPYIGVGVQYNIFSF